MGRGKNFQFGHDANSNNTGRIGMRGKKIGFCLEKGSSLGICTIRDILIIKNYEE